jgi:hypothetical protein
LYAKKGETEMNLNWKPIVPDNPPHTCIGFEATDQAGNRYDMPANREVVSIRLIDGREGCGWTPEQAYESASTRPLKCCDAPDVELVQDLPDGWSETNCKHCGMRRTIKMDYGQWIALLLGEESLAQTEAEMQMAADVAAGEAQVEQVRAEFAGLLRQLIDNDREYNAMQSKLFALQERRRDIMKALYNASIDYVEDEFVIKHDGLTWIVRIDNEEGKFVNAHPVEVIE